MNELEWRVLDRDSEGKVGESGGKMGGGTQNMSFFPATSATELVKTLLHLWTGRLAGYWAIWGEPCIGF